MPPLPLVLLVLGVLSAMATGPTATAAAATTSADGAVTPALLGRLAGELAVDPLARWLMLQPSEGVTPWRAGPILRNATLQPLFAAVDRCECVWRGLGVAGCGLADSNRAHTDLTHPHHSRSIDRYIHPGPDISYRLRTISTREIQWQRVQRPPPAPPRRKRAGNVSSDGDGGGEQEEELAPPPPPLEEEEQDEDEDEDDKPKEYMVFLLSKPGDYWSQQMDALVSAVLPSFPSVLFLRGRSSDHHKLVAQMGLRSVPQLFLFENSLLKVWGWMWAVGWRVDVDAVWARIACINNNRVASQPTRELHPHKTRTIPSPIHTRIHTEPLQGPPAAGEPRGLPLDAHGPPTRRAWPRAHLQSPARGAPRPRPPTPPSPSP